MPPIAISSGQREFITDAQSGFCVADELSLWEAGAAAPRRLSSCTIGEKLSLTGETSRMLLNGIQRSVIRVRQTSGTEGWVRAEYVIPDSILGVVVEEGAASYRRPDPAAPTSQTLKRMTVVAIHKRTAATDFLRISYTDPKDGRLLSAYARNTGISSYLHDVRSAILHAMAARTQNIRTRAGLLTLALNDYPQSKFTPEIRMALEAVEKPSLTDIPTEPFSGTFTAAEDGVNVLSIPDENAGSVVDTLRKGSSVDAVERTRQAYSVGSLSAPWYRLREPDGWVFGISLVPGSGGAQ